MKINKRFFFATVVLLVTYMLSACGAAPQQVEQSPGDQAAIKVRASEVAFTGVVEAINGTEWTVNGQALSVEPAVVQDGPFQVGDSIKIEGNVNPDGSITVSRVEAPTASDLTELPQLGNDNVNDNSNDANSNDDNANVNSNDANSNDDNTNINSNDDNSNDDDNSNGNSNDDNSNDDDDEGNSNDDSGSDDDGDSDDSSDDDDSGSNSGGDDD